MYKRKFLYIGSNDAFSRHELGFIASLREADIVVLGARPRARRLAIASDNGIHVVSLYEVPCGDLRMFHLCASVINSILNIDDYSAVFVTPRLPLLVAKALNASTRIILRLWSIKAAKLRDNLRFGAHEDILLFMPSVVANFYYIMNSTYAMALDHATYEFAKKVYPFVSGKVLKIYPPYGFIQGEDRVGQEIPEIIDRSSYILGFTILSKKGAYLKFEARPHAIILYLLAKRTKLDVVLAGSSYDDWRRVFPGLKPLKNLHIIGKGFSDDGIAKIYRNALLVISPITNRNISNRFLEALFYGKPIVTSEIVKFIHPELEHGRHIFISTWDTIIEDSLKLLEDEDLLKTLQLGAKEAYNKFFSTKRNIEIVKRLISE